MTDKAIGGDDCPPHGITRPIPCEQCAGGELATVTVRYYWRGIVGEIDYHEIMQTIGVSCLTDLRRIARAGNAGIVQTWAAGDVY
jgi:hypothetical protein